MAQQYAEALVSEIKQIVDESSHHVMNQEERGRYVFERLSERMRQSMANGQLPPGSVMFVEHPINPIQGVQPPQQRKV